MAKRPTYDVPVEARLVVKLDNGKEWEAKPEDLARFDLFNGLETYWKLSDRLRDILRDAGQLTADQDLTEAAINPFRRFIELGLTIPEMLDHREMDETYEEIVAIEQAILRDRARSATGASAPDPVADALRLHLLTEHKNQAAFNLDHAAAAEQHNYEHTSLAGTIRNHDEASLQYSVREALRLAADCDDDEEAADLAIELGAVLRRERDR